MSLFSKYIRSYLGTKLYAEPYYSFLDRSARPEAEPARRRLDSWFSRVPKSEAADIRGRFCGKDNTGYYSALFELTMHELLLSLGCSVDIHPDVSGDGHPDFLVKPPSGTPFYLEARLAQAESNDERANKARTNEVYDSLDRLKSPNFWIDIEVKGAPRTSVPRKKIQNRLERELETLDLEETMTAYERGGRDEMPSWKFEHDGWKLIIRPIPKPRVARDSDDSRPLGLWYPDTPLCNAREPIKDALEDKASKYGDLKAPYVIAVNALLVGVDSEDEMGSLFGEAQWNMTFGDSVNGGAKTRMRNGFWRGSAGPRRQNVSAVLLFRDLQVLNYRDVHVRLYHNPWATIRYDTVLTRLPQAVPREGVMELLDGDTVGCIMRGAIVKKMPAN